MRYGVPDRTPFLGLRIFCAYFAHILASLLAHISPPAIHAACPALGWASLNDSVVRSSVDNACFPCPAGSYGAHELRLYCAICAPGYICLETATSATPSNVSLQRGYPCPKGYYCPAGVTSEIPCPVGTYGDTPWRPLEP